MKDFQSRIDPLIIEIKSGENNKSIKSCIKVWNNLIENSQEDDSDDYTDSDLEEFKPILISAKNKSNIDTLKNKISSHINNLTGQIDNSTISNSRHYDLLNKTYEEIQKVKISISNNVSSDLVAIDIKQAIYFLVELTGEISNDEVLGNIFSKFCIGK